ncbi:MAG: class I SAM-dependent methyltransferase [Candidatus Thermoplasmatota archaeon]|nr:class I SAM-dependent methyltransferase [Euryarchaeota archaeon]MBU4032216.1 class I SAM-dependent methyltransferase [Candidatus Thermoplasmatota archaeon]MBU4070996.1 class I SAM-dependent methyltransferase [Candidatus Thermoplasmatota archaeon]MBU4143961.1 class I SAM-dependent methyltransferase [Candidatus Thermoplasmatota archaeon]MBU4592568.1 class I SAM-dependent methyltransferase [Candidatus Thermoplasmatota archaeon]
MHDDRRMYGDLSWTWPIISPPENYGEEANQFSSAIEACSKIPVKSLLNIGCGGGHIDFHLKNQYKITGMDISPEMLENAIKLNPEARYLKGDMRSVRLGEKFDSVIIADSITYMLSEDELSAAFRTAFEHLKPGGVFCTYAEELREKFTRTTFTHDARTAGDMDIILIEHKWDPDLDDSTIEFHFIFLIQEGGKLRVESDKHTCGLFPLKTWKRLLKKTGFSVRISEGQSGETLFTCLKPVG